MYDVPEPNTRILVSRCCISENSFQKPLNIPRSLLGFGEIMVNEVFDPWRRAFPSIERHSRNFAASNLPTVLMVFQMKVSRVAVSRPYDVFGEEEYESGLV